MTDKSKELENLQGDMYEEVCACGKKVTVKVGSKAFYCTRCGNSQLTGGNPGFRMPDTDVKGTVRAGKLK